MLKFVMLPPQDELRRNWAERLQQELSQYRVICAETDQEAQRELVDADAAFGWVPPDLLPCAARLRWLQSPQIAPPADFYYPELVAHPVVVTNPRGTFNDHIAQHVLMCVLALARGLPDYYDAQRQRRWNVDARTAPYVDLTSATALIVGVGGIGQEAARLCIACGMQVIGVDPRWEFDPPSVEKHSPTDLDTLLPRADFVIVTVPHTPETEGMWHADRFRCMKSSAYFINIGRGMTTRLSDLTAAIQDGTIAGCALDVFEVEPLPADHPLWAQPRVLLTPHIAAKDAENIPDRQFAILLDNAGRFAAHQPLRNVVDKTVWY
ncbi:MAG: D-2-hydroxyacid dehydrogenase [Planctomycetaceae bacterium]|nr:D-2-hydroxyacid dehydrogenase [Planctomycetaceae bacterium]